MSNGSWKWRLPLEDQRSFEMRERDREEKKELCRDRHRERGGTGDVSGEPETAAGPQHWCGGGSAIDQTCCCSPVAELDGGKGSREKCERTGESIRRDSIPPLVTVAALRERERMRMSERERREYSERDERREMAEGTGAEGVGWSEHVAEAGPAGRCQRQRWSCNLQVSVLET